MSSPAYEPGHCVVCGHSRAVVVTEHDDVQREVEELWEYHEQRLRPGTPSRFLLDRVAFSQHPPFRIVRCVDCGLLYRNPVERVRELVDAYQSDTTPTDVLRGLHDNQLATARVQARHLKRVLGRGGTGLEVGSYVASFLAAAREEGLHFEGLDVNRDVNAFARTMGFTVHDGTLGSFAANRTFDVVAVWNTFDQLADPRAAVYAAYGLLRPGGLLCLRVPNGAFYAANRALVAGGRARRGVGRTVLAQNNLLAFPYRWGFTVESLSRLLGEAGFTVSDTRGDSLVATSDGFTRMWARLEEAVVKSTVSAFSRRFPARAPWFEIFARKG